MRRFGAAVLAGAIGFFMMPAGDAAAWYYGRHGHHFGHGHHFRHGFHFGHGHGFHRSRHHFSFGFHGYYPYRYPYRYRYYPYRYGGYYPYRYGYAPVGHGGRHAGGGHSLLGAILGGVGGGVIGHQIGGGSGRTAATVVGSLLGVLIGSEIGRQLGERDRLIMARETQSALETSPSGRSSEWVNPDTGHRGTVVPKPAYKDARGQVCREFQQTVVIGGKKESAYGTACRQPDGSWKIVK